MERVRGMVMLMIAMDQGLARAAARAMSGALIKVSLPIMCLWCLTGCGVTSLIPGAADTPPTPTAGEQLNLPVTPEEAIAVLREVALQNGWKLVRTGDQRDLQGLRGKYFWLQAEKFVGGRQYVSGVFFNDPAGTYVMVGNADTGLPESLVEPLMTAVEAKGEKRR